MISHTFSNTPLSRGCVVVRLRMFEFDPRTHCEVHPIQLYIVTFISDVSALLRTFLVYRANANGEFIVLRKRIRICMIVASYAYQSNPDSYSFM